MKTKFTIATAALFALALAVSPETALAKKKAKVKVIKVKTEIAFADLPVAVAEAFIAQFPDAAVEKVEHETRTKAGVLISEKYEVEFVVDGMEWSAEYLADGTLKELENEGPEIEND